MKKFVFAPFLLLAVMLAVSPAPPATSQPLPIVQHIAKTLPAQVKDELKVDGAGIKDVEKVVMVPKVITVKTVQSFPFTVTAPPGAGLYFWTYPPLLDVVDRNDSIEVKFAPKVDLNISVKAIYVDLDKDGKFLGFKTKFYSTKLVIGEVPPGPGPGPGPGPNPPVPPTPEPAPIDADGLHVMVIFETGDKDKLPPGQFDIIYGADMRAWLKANCAPDTQTNDKKAYWMIDKDSDLSQLDKKWQNAAKRPRQSIPWLIVSNRQKGGFEGALPADTQAAIKLMEKYK